MHALTLALLAAVPVFDSQGRAATPLSDRVVDYTIEAKLVPALHKVEAHEQVTWRNRSAVPQRTLWLHAYWNAFKNERSTFFRDVVTENGSRDLKPGAPDYPGLKKDEWGYLDLKSFKVRKETGEPEDLLTTLRYMHPDDANEDDRTVFTVTLADPVPPGGKITLDIAWEAQVPKTVERAGRWHDYYLVGQWFPKLGVLEIPGERGVKTPAWNCHQYHANTEFYSDFGTFDVKLTVPSAYKVGAVGVRTDSHDNGDGTRTDHFHQDDVHDFAWTAWPKFVELEDTFREPGLPEVKLTALVPPGNEAAGEQMFAALKASLHFDGTAWYPYPYPHITVVGPPIGAIASGGMEYPTFITSVSRRDPKPGKDYTIWETTIHEIGHNYWYGMLASNEFEEAWLDEGINSYGTAKVMMAEDVRMDLSQMPPGPLRPLLGNLLKSNLSEADLRKPDLRRHSSPIVREGWNYRTQEDYSTNSYLRPELALYALEDLLGPETMGRVMRTYAQRFKFKHPGTHDFFAVAHEVSGRDLSGFEAKYFHSTDDLDYGVAELECSDSDPGALKGVFENAQGVRVVGEGKSGKGAEVEARTLHTCEVTLERLGNSVEPVTIIVTFDDGTREVEHWDGVEKWHRLTYERKGKLGEVAAVVTHTELGRWLDIDTLNDSYARKARVAAPLSLTAWMTYSMQLVTSSLSSLF